jgi:hypothetical protein
MRYDKGYLHCSDALKLFKIATTSAITGTRTFTGDPAAWAARAIFLSEIQRLRESAGQSSGICPSTRPLELIYALRVKGTLISGYRIP